MLADLKRFSPLLLVLIIAAPFALYEAPSTLPVFAWGVAKVAAFGLLGVALDRLFAPYSRPHKLADLADTLRAMARMDPTEARAAETMQRAADWANMRRAITVLGCQLAGAML